MVTKEYVKLTPKEIIPYEKNARKNDAAVSSVVESIKQCDYIANIVVDENNVILAGHTRFKALKRLKFGEIDVCRVNGLTDEQKRKYRLLDNKTTELAEWDFDLLQEEVADLDFGDLKLDWGIELDETPTEVVEDEVPEIDEESEPIAKLGDIWKLGRHRLMCGDSTDKATVEKLMNGNKADMLFTDPPYNVAFNGRSGKFDVIKNDDLETTEFERFITKVVDIIKTVKPQNYYIWCNWKFYSTLQTKLDFKSCIVWAKNVFGMGIGYRHQHEFCLFNGTIDESIKNESDLWNIAKDTNYIHPTQKPVGLCARALKNHTKDKNILDLFGGSGSTLIACEQLNRTCYTMELDPKYVDVIIKRWENLTGEKAELLNEQE